MNRFNPQQRAEIMTIFILKNKLVVLTQREYRKRHRNQSAPDKKTKIFHLFQNCKQTKWGS